MLCFVFSLPYPNRSVFIASFRRAFFYSLYTWLSHTILAMPVSILPAGMYVCMYVCTFVCMYVCTFVCMYVHLYVCMYVHLYVCMYVCTFVCMYVPYISELTPGINRCLVSFTSLVISSDNVNRGLVLFLLLCLIYKPGHN